MSADVRDSLSLAPGLGGDRRHLDLSPREFEVFRLLAQGRSVDEIALQMFLSLKTVANYQTMLRKKMQLNNTLDMHRYAQQHKLL
ncbi:Transcriptional activator protein ExaE [compost metagenome]